MQKTLLVSPRQFAWQPKIENGPIGKYQKYILLGMGGSHLAADILNGYDPTIFLRVHSDYGLPGSRSSNFNKPNHFELSLPGKPFVPSSEQKQTLVIASSFSGNTEEVIDGLQIALKQKLAVAILAKGGKLIEIAQKKKLPYIQFPDEDLQPRLALGYSIRALLTLLGHEKGLRETTLLAKKSDVAQARKKAAALSKKIAGLVPIIYTSNHNRAVGYNWKIKLNETGKIPAFCNVLPELNHNEMTGFDVQPQNRDLSSKFHFLFITDDTDSAPIKKRFAILEELYKARALPVTLVPLTGTSRLERIFSSLMVADWLSLAIATHYGTEAEQVPMVEEFKRLMNNYSPDTIKIQKAIDNKI